MAQGPAAPVTLRTERLVLRPWTDADREPFAALNADPEVMRWFPSTLTRAQSDEMVDRILAGFAHDGFGLWAVEVVGGPAFVGYVGLCPVPADLPPAPAVEVGWRLARTAWGRGYASEAAAEALRFAFEDLGLDEVVSFTAVPNERSQAVMRRVGLHRDEAGDFGHPRVDPASPIRPHVLYRLGAGAWRASRSSSA